MQASSIGTRHTAPPLGPQVWAAADNKRQGFLDFNAFVKALELMSLAQVRLRAASRAQVLLLPCARQPRARSPLPLGWGAH